MKKYFLMLLFLPLIGIGQTKTVLTVHRLYAKNDKITEFEAALSSHAQKYHTGDVKWRVWSIETGPDAGAYLISEGPSTWKDLDGRGEISPEHQSDWEKNVMPLTTGKWQKSYYDFQSAMSTVLLTDYADKIVIDHLTPNPGKTRALNTLINKLKKVWDVSKESVAVYAILYSGEPGFVTVTRLRDGLKELSSDYRKTLEERYNEVFGARSFDKWLKEYADAVQSRWSELLVFKPELSSK